MVHTVYFANWSELNDTKCGGFATNGLSLANSNPSSEHASEQPPTGWSFLLAMSGQEKAYNFSGLRTGKVMDGSGKRDLVFLKISNHLQKNCIPVTFHPQVFKAGNAPFCPPFRWDPILDTLHTCQVQAFAEFIFPGPEGPGKIRHGSQTPTRLPRASFFARWTTCAKWELASSHRLRTKTGPSFVEPSLPMTTKDSLIYRSVFIGFFLTMAGVCSIAVCSFFIVLP